jgi:hypothetical protein
MRKTERLWGFSLVGIIGMLCLPVSVSAAEMIFQSDTLFRFFQRDTATEQDAAVAPVYQYLKFDIGNPNVPGLAFYLNAWGRWDMADNNYFREATDGELLYGYLEYRGEQAQFNARFGRQQVFEGVANDAVDGLKFSSDLGRYFSGSVYAGQPAALDSEQGRSGDSIYGGHLVHHMIGWYDLGLSYKKIRNNSNDVEEMAGVDLSAYLPHGINLYGFSAYNLDTEDWGEHSYELDFTIGPVSLRPYYQKFQYEDYFGTTAILVNPFRFLAGTGEELQVGGADLTMPVGDSWTLAAKAKHYDYKVLDDTSQYISGQATWSSEGRTQIGAELGYMNGDAAQNDYYLVRLFSYWDQLPDSLPLSFVSGDLIYVGYDQEIYGKDSSLFVSMGAGRKFLKEALEIKLSGDYSCDPYFDGDLRGMLTASYSFGREL